MASKERETGVTPDIAYNKDGLVPAIVQDVDSGEVLMMAWMNDEAVRHTLETRKATFYSRSRGKMWVKGETSGHVQQVVQFLVDCDQDTVLLRVKSHGPACHVGYPTCFFREWPPGTGELKVVQERAFDPDDVYRK